MASYFVIYSESDEGEVLKLIGDIKVTRISLKENQDQIDEETKKQIIKCNVFVCFLSKNSSQLLLDVAKFARCIARKKIYWHFISGKGSCKMKDEEKSFFDEPKTNKFQSFEKIEQVKIF